MQPLFSKRKDNIMYTKSQLFSQLKELGAPRDSIILMHTSLKAVGEVEGRGEGLLDALIEYFTADGGLFCVPTHTWKNLSDRSRPTLDLTPDDPKYSPEFAKRIINSGLICETESVETLRNSYPGKFSDAEIRELVGHIEQRYKSRLNKYERGEKLWDTTILIIMVVRGTKPE